MKKTLSLILAIAMLASLCTVPAWAEEDATLDFPVIEEVTEEELEEELELFGEDVELFESTVEVHDFEITEDDGVTYLTEIDGVKISFTGSSEATIASIGNGKYTTGTWGGANTDANNKFYWYDGNNAEGFMGLPTTKANPTTITVDFGEPKTFSGIKVYDSVRSRSLIAGGARDIKTINMQVSNDNLFKWYALDAITRTDAGSTEVGTFPFMAGGTAVNVTARYLKFTVSGVHTWGEFELEELVMIDPVAENATKVMDTDITVNVDMPAALTAAEKEGVTMLSADTAKVVFKGNGKDAEVLSEKSAVIDGKRSGWGDWGLNTSAPTDRYFTVELTNPTAFAGVRVWMHTRNASWANGYFSGDKSQNGFVRRIPETAKAMISDDGINWEPVEIEISRNDTYWYLDMPFAFEGAAKNFTAKYIRVYPTKILGGWGEWEVGEVALLNTNAELDTYESVKEISDEVEGRYGYYRAGKFFSYKSGSGTPIVYEGNTYTNTGDWNAVDRLFDGDLSGTSYYHTAANIPTVDSTEDNKKHVPIPKEIRTITITFNEATQIGGFRVYPRTDNTGGNPYRVNVYASNDGENYTLVRNMAKVFSSTDKGPKKVVLEKGLPAYKYYKFEVYSTAGSGSTTAHTCYSELQVLKPMGLDLTEGDFIPCPANDVKVESYIIKDGKETLFRGNDESFAAIDGIIVNQELIDQAVATGESQYAFQLSHDGKIWGCKGGAAAPTGITTADSAYVLLDLGSVQTFSGVRIYGRTGQANQAFKEGIISISDDGENWFAADEIKTDAPFINTIPLTFLGESFDIKARYVKIHCLVTKSGHWSFEEIRLLNPVDADSAKTKDEIIEALESKVTDVIDLIAAIETADDKAAAVAAARTAYNALPESLKDDVTNLDVLEAAEEAIYAEGAAEINAKIAAIKPWEVELSDGDAIKALRVEYEALPEEVKPFVAGLDVLEKAHANLTQKIDLTQQERTVESGKYGSQLGYTPVDYTLYVSDDEVEVTEVKYKGEAVDNTYDKWTFVNNGDGTLTLTLAGNYWNDPAKKAWLYSSSMHESIKKGEGNYWVFANDYPVFDVKKGDTLNPDKFVGTFVRDVSLDNLGDHKITVVLSDGTEKEINLRSYVSWSNLNTNPKSASEDAIQPSTSWKIASTNTSIESRAFDGNLTNGTNSTTFVAAYNDKDGNKVHTGQHILFGVGHTVWLDLATPTKIGGIRLYNNNKDVLNDVELYGSNDLETWTLIGSVKDNNTKSITVTTINNDAYRYIEVKNTKYNNGSPTYAWYSEIEVLKAETRVAGNNVVTFDPSEEIEAEFAIALEGEETLTGVTDAEDEAIEYTYEDGVITIDRDYLLTLANGTYAFKATFSNGAVVTLTVDKKDSSKTSYLLADKSTGRASEALELESLSGKAVAGVSVNGANIEYSVNGNNTIITIGRRAFRNSYELFATMDVVTNGVVEVLVTYEDESTKTFYVTITSEWLTIGEPTADFKADEVIPATGAWKIRTSAASSEHNTGVGAFYLPAQNSANHQNWHTSYTGAGNVADQDLDHFIDVDFGANAPSYNGVRIMERVGGSFYAKITVYGKNADGEEWTLLGEATPGKANPVEVKFADTVNYRYVRMRFDGNSTHVTADTIHFTKAVASLASDKTVTVDTNVAETATFKFNLVEGAASAIEVKVDGNVIENTNYTWAEGKLVLSAEYTATLAEGDHTVTATIDAFPITLTIKKADKYTVSYVLAGGDANPRGTENLVLGIPAGKTVSGITYKGAEVTYTTTENNIIISRSAFRNLDDMFDMTSLKLDVTFEGDEEATPYTVNLSKVAFTVSGADAANFAEDEIVAADGWKVMVSSARDAMGAPSRMFIKPAGVDNAWHTGYEEKNGQAIADSAFPRNYLEVDFGEEALKAAGFRYYARSEANQASGVWQGVIVYGRNSADEDWKEIKSQDFAWADWKNVRETTVYFSEDVSYKQLRFVIDCDGHATGRGFAFLKPGSRPEAPEESEGKVNVQVTPSTGGNVIVNDAPTFGDNFVPKNEEVTFTATPDVTGEGAGFMYWVEANTGKILGRDATLTVKATSGKDIKAVFADPTALEVFVSFFGRNASAVIAHNYVKKGNAPIAPSEEKLYTTGYNFIGWVTDPEAVEDENAEVITELGTVNAATSFYAVYEAKTTKQSKITVEGGKVKNEEGTFVDSATFAYDSSVVVKANTPANGQKFSHWEIDGKAVSYKSTYAFFAPDADVDIVAVFVATDAEVKEEINITITKTTDSVNGVKVASFLTTRYVPKGVEVLETGVIYVKDASYGALSIAEIGKTSANGKAVKIATCDKTTSGQYKLTASYVEGLGIKARGFITYLDGETVKTIYTEELSQN